MQTGTGPLEAEVGPTGKHEMVNNEEWVKTMLGGLLRGRLPHATCCARSKRH
jgi:hypothetical protein